MLVSHRHQFIFLKTRKTAGTSLEGLLEHLCVPNISLGKHKRSFIETEHGIIAGRAGGERPEDPLTAHASANQICAYLGADVFGKYMKIVPIRNPFDKVISWFWWRHRGALSNDSCQTLKDDFGKTQQMFRDWLLGRPRLPVDTQFYRTRSGAFEAHLIRYETLSNDVLALATKLGIEVHLEDMPLWKSKVRHHAAVSIADYYDTETSGIVRKAFSYDFRNFGYETEPPIGSNELQNSFWRH